MPIREHEALAAWVDEVLAEHPSEMARYRAGEIRLMGFLTGEVMKKSRGRADPKGVQPLLERRLGSQ